MATIIAPLVFARWLLSLFFVMMLTATGAAAQTMVQGRVEAIAAQSGQLDLHQILQYAATSFNANRQSAADGSDHFVVDSNRESCTISFLIS